MPTTPVPLDSDSVDPDPIVQFRRWYDEAVAAGVGQPDAMTVATAAQLSEISARTVLLRGIDTRGFVFYSNFASTKGRQLEENPHAALVFHWREQERQVRVEGVVGRVEQVEAVEYWDSRPRGHRISAWSSPQSSVVELAELQARVTETEARFADADPPLPPFWGGFRVTVESLECWQGRPDRLHDRVRYRVDPHGGWIRERLAP